MKSLRFSSRWRCEVRGTGRWLAGDASSRIASTSASRRTSLEEAGRIFGYERVA